MALAKHETRTMILLGHVTKDGSLAGPKVLEHLGAGLLLELLLALIAPQTLALHVKAQARDGVVLLDPAVDFGRLAVCRRVVARAVVADTVHTQKIKIKIIIIKSK